MAHTRDLYKTKLCTLYQRGNCPRQSCSFAHGEAELRRFPGTGGFNGRQENHRVGDLRDRLEKRGSPTHRKFSSKDGRGGRRGRFISRYRGHSHTQSPSRRRTSSSYTPPSDRKESKKSLERDAQDGHLSDLSGDHSGDKQFEAVKAKSPADSPSASPRNALQEQLKQVQLENETLIEEKEALEKDLGTKVEEASLLTAQNSEVEVKLYSSQQEYKRHRLKMRKMIKVYKRYTHAQEEVKKTQLKLQRIAAEDCLKEEALRPAIHVDDSDYYNLSDGEIARSPITADGLSALNVQTSKGVDMDKAAIIAKRKRLRSIREKARASLQKMQQNGDLESCKEQRSGSELSPSLRSSPLNKVQTPSLAHGLGAQQARDNAQQEETEPGGVRGYNAAVKEGNALPLDPDMTPSIKLCRRGEGFFKIGRRTSQRSKLSGDNDGDVDEDVMTMDEHI